MLTSSPSAASSSSRTAASTCRGCASRTTGRSACWPRWTRGWRRPRAPPSASAVTSRSTASAATRRASCSGSPDPRAPPSGPVLRRDHPEPRDALEVPTVARHEREASVDAPAGLERVANVDRATLAAQRRERLPAEQAATRGEWERRRVEEGLRRPRIVAVRGAQRELEGADGGDAEPAATEPGEKSRAPPSATQVVDQDVGVTTGSSATSPTR